MFRRSMGARQLIAVVTVTALCLQLTGCYTHEAIKPTELPKVNGAYARTVGSTPNPDGTTTAVVDKSVAHLERPDGTLVEIQGPTDARITLQNGQQIDFEHPLFAEVEAESLFVKGGNLAQQEYELRQIDSVELSKFSPGRSLLLSLGISTVVAGLTIGLLAAAAP